MADQVSSCDFAKVPIVIALLPNLPFVKVLY